MTKTTIWCLFSIENNYDQPNNLVRWWATRPSLDVLAKFLAKPLDKATDDEIIKVVEVWKGNSTTLGTGYSNTRYRLEEVAEGSL
jgi:hypothetical protein